MLFNRNPKKLFTVSRLKVPLGFCLFSVVGYHHLPSQNQYDVYGSCNSFINLFRAAYVVLYSVYDYSASLKNLDSTNDDYYIIRSACHQRCADRILWLAIINKGIYFKGGQYVGNLARIVPKEFIETLKVLQDSGPQVPFHAVKTVIEYDTK
jgi:predicted unusual protein kinase regulating ubiquinone biosynthesis (AarF/ABC1/UbiB family)